jgi:hypothetical protein
MPIKYVQINKKDVKAILREEPTKSLECRVMENAMYKNPELFKISYSSGFEYNTYVAFARCSESDTFDPQVGAELSKLRVLEKFYKNGMKEAQNIIDRYKAIASEAEKQLERYQDRYNLIHKNKVEAEEKANKKND